MAAGEDYSSKRNKNKDKKKDRKKYPYRKGGKERFRKGEGKKEG